MKNGLVVARGQGMGVAMKGQPKSSCDDGTVVNLDCVNVNLLVAMIYYYNTAKCHHWGKQGKEYRVISLFCFLQLYMNLQ